MSDSFISYARSDLDKAKAIAEEIERKGYKVWWDSQIPAGRKFDEVIEIALGEAKCVVVLWSKESIRRDWVKEEADIGMRRGILLPAMIEPVNPPLGFRQIQAVDLTVWTPHQPHDGFSALVKRITVFVGVSGAKEIAPGLSARSEQDAKHPLRAIETPTTMTNSIGVDFVLISPGSFMMGSRRSLKRSLKEVVDFLRGDERRYKYEKPYHGVKIERPFYLQTTPVTQGQWQRVMGDNPSHFKDGGDDCPVENISWDRVREFIKKLNQIKKTKAYRLPSEAEWEYACRAGCDAEFAFGDDANRFGEFAWYKKNSEWTARPVSQKKPNAWGLYDMHGNVWEWMEDDWHDSYEGAPADGRAWVDGPRGALRVVRGGSWGFDARHCRSAARIIIPPEVDLLFVGFRLSRSVAPDS